MTPKLQFVYNADAGLFSKLTDFAHKALLPETYACSLCALTYGTFAIKQEWTAYLQKLPVEVEFLYKNEWELVHGREQYPFVVLQTDADTKMVLSAKELNSFKMLQQLKDALNKALQLA